MPQPIIEITVPREADKLILKDNTVWAPGERENYAVFWRAEQVHWETSEEIALVFDPSLDMPIQFPLLGDGLFRIRMFLVPTLPVLGLDAGVLVGAVFYDKFNGVLVALTGYDPVFGYTVTVIPSLEGYQVPTAEAYQLAPFRGQHALDRKLLSYKQCHGASIGRGRNSFIALQVQLQNALYACELEKWRDAAKIIDSAQDLYDDQERA